MTLEHDQAIEDAIETEIEDIGNVNLDDTLQYEEALRAAFWRIVALATHGEHGAARCAAAPPGSCPADYTDRSDEHHIHHCILRAEHEVVEHTDGSMWWTGPEPGYKRRS